jgi:hypothetical protein
VAVFRSTAKFTKFAGFVVEHTTVGWRVCSVLWGWVNPNNSRTTCITRIRPLQSKRDQKGRFPRREFSRWTCRPVEAVVAGKTLHFGSCGSIQCTHTSNGGLVYFAATLNEHRSWCGATIIRVPSPAGRQTSVFDTHSHGTSRSKPDPAANSGRTVG